MRGRNWGCSPGAVLLAFPFFVSRCAGARNSWSENAVWVGTFGDLRDIEFSPLHAPHAQRAACIPFFLIRLPKQNTGREMVACDHVVVKA